ncbi:hypothetical protein [Pseudomonas sp. SBB6]|uniref:hypothetical protein n=1 Tax=Pseudomonas sp. SBB6 TaxID=2962032 RepID=UPI0020B75006|nr:hypothetical protein [Pseudomonas sp. SBB6]MCP3751819.1 hypothetical protein [Pseudomonas sp. SBB6]
MHDTNTWGGLVHRRGHKPRPVGQLGDAVEGDIARGVPGFEFATEYIFILLIYKDFILFYVNSDFPQAHSKLSFYIS